jgi:hypothetical protein
MIDELSVPEYEVQEQNHWKINLPQQALSRSHYEIEVINDIESSRESSTHAFRESKEEEQTMISILQMCRLGGTIALFRLGEFHAQYYKFSTDLAERANFGYSVAAAHLSDNFSIPSHQNINKKKQMF